MKITMTKQLFFLVSLSILFSSCSNLLSPNRIKEIKQEIETENSITIQVSIPNLDRSINQGRYIDPHSSQFKLEYDATSIDTITRSGEFRIDPTNSEKKIATITLRNLPIVENATLTATALDESNQILGYRQISIDLNDPQSSYKLKLNLENHYLDITTINENYTPIEVGAEKKKLSTDSTHQVYTVNGVRESGLYSFIFSYPELNPPPVQSQNETEENFNKRTDEYNATRDVKEGKTSPILKIITEEGEDLTPLYQSAWEATPLEEKNQVAINLNVTNKLYLEINATMSSTLQILKTHPGHIPITME